MEREKLESERESPEMETPARKQQINDTISKFEESPVFNFINSLSPLKTVNSLRISQRFNSFSFPSVSSVFTSPQVSSTKGAELLKKHRHSDPSSTEFSTENEIKIGNCEGVMNFVGNSNEQAVNVEENTEVSTSQNGLKFNLHGGAEIECSLEGSSGSDVLLGQEPSGIKGMAKNEDRVKGDWERVISKTGDLLIFDSPYASEPYKGTLQRSSDTGMSLSRSLISEYALDETNTFQNVDAAYPDEIEPLEYEPYIVQMDDEPLLNLHRGVRRRCLVFEMSGVRNTQLNDASSSDPSVILPYDSMTEALDKQTVCIKPLHDSSCSIFPGIGLHLNALTNTSNNKIFSRKIIAPNRQLTNEFSSGASQPLTDLGQNYLDKSSEGTSIEDPAQSSGWTALEDINQNSPKKKRCKSENDGEHEGCKRCNCKKSKCLKLYCECFAAGVYCVEPCSCQECFNKPIHEDIVLATRKQIESRNPLAFAPKVVRTSENAPYTVDESKKTPASARHKRGCNCKKSGCLKKYCECYQEGVGCSINCRCEGCKNTFGRKDGSFPIGPDSQREEDERETLEKSVMDKSLHENVIQNSVQLTDNCSLPETPSRASNHLPFSSKRKSPWSSFHAIGSSFKINGNRKFENPSSLQDQLKFEKQSEAVQGDYMPEAFQGNVSSSLCLVKSSSPNSKRVSPSHYEFEPSLNRTSSRKLILQSIPSFPSLTPKQ